MDSRSKRITPYSYSLEWFFDKPNSLGETGNSKMLIAKTKPKAIAEAKAIMDGIARADWSYARIQKHWTDRVYHYNGNYEERQEEVVWEYYPRVPLGIILNQK